MQFNTGFSASTTITLNEQVASVFPEASVSVNVIVVVPIGNSEPLAGPVLVNVGLLQVLLKRFRNWKKPIRTTAISMLSKIKTSILLSQN